MRIPYTILFLCLTHVSTWSALQTLIQVLAEMCLPHLSNVFVKSYAYTYTVQLSKLKDPQLETMSEIHFPDGLPHLENPQVTRLCFVASPRTTARSSSKWFGNILFLVCHSWGDESWFNHSTCKSWRVSSGYLRRYRSHHLRSWDILCLLPSHLGYKAIYDHACQEKITIWNFLYLLDPLRVWCVGFKDFLSSFSK